MDISDFQRLEISAFQRLDISITVYNVQMMVSKGWVWEHSHVLGSTLHLADTLQQPTGAGVYF